jgi:predicted transcriptional regulator
MRKRVRAATREGMVVTTIALREEVSRRLSMAALEDRTVMTELVRQAVDEWLERRKRTARGRSKKS